MSKIALIPARKGSKGIPKKNIVDLLGKPLIAWTILKAKKSCCFDSVIVSTDCEKIAEISLEYGAEVPFLRPQEISSDLSSRNDVINHFFESKIDCEKMIYLQPTSPFRSIKSIIKFNSFVNENSKFPSISVSHVSDNPSTILRQKQNGQWKYIEEKFSMNRQISSDKVFKLDGSFFYINRNYWLKMNGNAYDFMRTKDTRYFINDLDGLTGGIDIDNYSDLEFSRKLKMNF